MEIRVLGCYGGELPGYNTTCFMINNNMVVDAGAITTSLPIEDQKKVDAIFLTHSHLDHVRDIGFLVDNIFGQRDRPVMVYGLAESIESVKKHVMNDLVWPDFSKLPTPEDPVMVYQEVSEGETVEMDGVRVVPVKVSHTVPTAGYIISNGSKSVAISGDTGPTDEFWKKAGQEGGLQAVLLEASFPDRMASLAEVSGHLTPASARSELEKLGKPEVSAYLYHMKPQFLREISEEVEAADHPMRLLRQGEVIHI